MCFDVFSMLDNQALNINGENVTLWCCFSVDFQKHFRLANLLQHTDFQNILKTVAPIYIFWWHVLDCLSIIYELIEICQRTICADSGNNYIY